MTNYLSISYKDALEFLNKLSEEQLEDYYYKYDINSEYGDKNEQLAEIISDDDLIVLGYVMPSDMPDNDEEDKEENIYSISYDDVLHFLGTLDVYVIEELLAKYDINTLEDLAVAITDNELIALGYGNNEKVHETVRQIDNDDKNKEITELFLHYDEYDSDLDYLEDIDSDINYNVLDKENHIYSVDTEEDFYRFKSCLDPNLVEYCVPLDYDIGIDGFIFTVEPKIYDDNVEISEEVIINNELNSLIFDENHQMIEEVRQQLIDYANQFVEKMNDKDVDLEYSDLNLVGSNAGYLYLPTSDIDVHFISSNPLDEHTFELLKNEFDIFEIENPLVIGEGNVELGIEDGYNIIMDNKDSRRYSLIDNNWVDDSDKNEVYTNDDLSAVEGYEEIVDTYTQKIDDIIEADEYEDAIELKYEIRQNRSDDLKNIGALSLGNVVFKELRNNGAYGKLRNYIKEKESQYSNDIT